MKNLLIFTLITLFAGSCVNPASQNGHSGQESQAANDSLSDSLRYESETHLKAVKQLTFGGDNAEAYFSFNNEFLVFQATNPEWDAECDQIFYMPANGSGQQRARMLSTGLGKTTCAYFLPGDTSILYASTHLAMKDCPETPRVINGKYVWPVYEDFDIFVADLNGNIIKQLTDNPGYDAEATISPDGKTIVFTSTRSGDLELYTMDIQGGNIRQITDELGYDGGAFFSPDSKRLIFRASRPKLEEEVKNYKELLALGLVQPTNMELFICNADGSDMRQITDLGKASWAPFFHPSGKKILFSSNHHSENGRQFNIFSINTDGSGIEQITFDEAFDAFPMFSPDGKVLAFSSNRNNKGTRDTNVFVAEWSD